MAGRPPPVEVHKGKTMDFSIPEKGYLKKCPVSKARDLP
jgi:hypothetical protein